MLSRVIFSLLTALAASLLLGFAVLPLLRRFKAGQPVLHYVKEHASKSGTPTMGGVIFLTAIALSYFIWNGFENNRALVALGIMLAYGLVGAIDDVLKITAGKNKGLAAYQKIIFQLAIALIAAFFAAQIGSVQIIPFLGVRTDLGGFAAMLYVFIFLAITNGVNLTDGLDGLESKVSAVNLVSFSALLCFSLVALSETGQSYEYADTLALLSLCAAAAGALLGFLFFNAYPAKVFMGDTGSLGLGGLIGAAAVFSEYALFLPLLGIMFVVSCASVIIQVGYFKATGGRRVFLMAPYHHHLQQKGMHENHITTLYFLITVAVCLAAIAFTPL